MTAERQELAIDEFQKRFSTWTRQTASREYAAYFLKRAGWNVDKALDIYWREHILIY